MVIEKNKKQRKTARFCFRFMFVKVSLLYCCLLSLAAGYAQGGESDWEAWKAAQIADAISAAPPSVTHDATLYAWQDDGKLVLLRHGSGPHVCFATGQLSLRVGLPRPPFPDPMCMDPNAWAFFSAVWAEKNPLKPEKPYPNRPGIVWMLAGMGVPDGMVQFGADTANQFKVDSQGKKVVKLSPHIMLMPLPVNGKSSVMPSHYNVDEPQGSWVMGADLPIEHVMIHFTDDDVASMMMER